MKDSSVEIVQTKKGLELSDVFGCRALGDCLQLFRVGLDAILGDDVTQEILTLSGDLAFYAIYSR